MRRRVSGAMPTLNHDGGDVVVLEEGGSSVMVRQVPLTQMESPSWASERKVGSEEVEMVREVPEPPVAEGSRGRRDVTAVETGEKVDQDCDALVYRLRRWE